MPIYKKTEGQWIEIKKIYSKKESKWKEVAKGWVKSDGEWKLMFNSLDLLQYNGSDVYYNNEGVTYNLT